MSSGSKEAPIDYLTLGEFLEALAYPVRLALLDSLRFPHTAKEIKLQPHRIHRGANPERDIARQTVQTHLDLLVEQGLVRAEEVEAGGKATTYYVTNPSRLYAMTEELRRLSQRYAGQGADAERTGTLGQVGVAEQVAGPRLVLVHGVYVGKAFALDPRAAEQGRWIIGRKKGLPVCLDYDAYVSMLNSAIERRAGQYTITDLEASKNGTLVNWTRLPTGGSRPLKAGDVVGVGRSLLSFIAE